MLGDCILHFLYVKLSLYIILIDKKLNSILAKCNDHVTHTSLLEAQQFFQQKPVIMITENPLSDTI